MKIKIGNNGEKMFNCPGCGFTHSFDDRWKWDGNKDEPTFTPSLLVTYPRAGIDHRCHSFVTRGKIRYLNDCTHDMANKTVELPEWAGLQMMPIDDSSSE